MNSNVRDLARLLRRRSVVDWCLAGFAVLAFSWIPAALILIFRDADLRPTFQIFYQLWPLSVLPLGGFAICWVWRSSLKRKIIAMESRHDA
jgi:hypothetical protein